MSDQTIKVPLGTAPIRLDVFLANHTDLSRSKLQKHIKAGAVSLNGKVLNAHHNLRGGDTIVVTDLDIEYREHVEPKVSEPSVVFENEYVLVINKPTGWVAHGGPGIHETTVADWAIAHDPKIGMVGDHPEQRPGIVHRLDRDVSGVMVIAKTQQSYNNLKKQFQDHSTIKEYLALALGRIVAKSGRITFAIARKADKSGLMVARPNSQEGKEAETRFTVVRQVKSMSLVRVRTMTGRTHQIRVHFKAIDHPLVGDKLYRRRGKKPLRVEPPRLFLHATVLGFTDVDGTVRRFEVPLAEDLQQYLNRVG